MEDRDNLTVAKLLDAYSTISKVPKMPRWKDLTWAERNIIEREIDSIENRWIRESMRVEYYRDDD